MAEQITGDVDVEIVALLVDRMNHLEELLVNNLLGFLVTATSTVLAGVYVSRKDRKAFPQLSPRSVLIGANVMYVFLAGYYYFMLAQFYAAVVVLTQVTRNVQVPTEDLWSVLRTPTFGTIDAQVANLVILSAAPMFPLAFATCGLIACWWLVRPVDGSRAKSAPGLRDVLVGVLCQAITASLMIVHPFTRFIEATRG